MLNVRTAAIVVNWNSWKELDGCLKAIMGQSLPFHRILVIDNDSSDPMPEPLSCWQVNHNVEFKVLPDNVGFATANNIGLGIVSDCSWVALINPDAFLDPSWHKEMLLAVQQYPTAASFSSALVMANDRTRWDGKGDVYHMSGLVWRSAHGKRVENMANEGVAVFSPCAAAAFYKRQAMLEVDGFDDDYFCYVEDVDLGFRLQLMGYGSMLVPTATGAHVGSATTGGKHSDFAVYHGHRNLVWTFIKDMPGALFWLLFPLHVIMSIATMVVFSMRGQGGTILHAKWDALKGVSNAWRKRRLIQRDRRCSVSDIWRILDKRLIIWK